MTLVEYRSWTAICVQTNPLFQGVSYNIHTIIYILLFRRNSTTIFRIRCPLYSYLLWSFGRVVYRELVLDECIGWAKRQWVYVGLNSSAVFYIWVFENCSFADGIVFTMVNGSTRFRRQNVCFSIFAQWNNQVYQVSTSFSTQLCKLLFYSV